VEIDLSGRADGLHQADLLRRIADTVAIMLYQMELLPDGSFNCLEFIGLETVIGTVPEGVRPEEAYEAAVHPDDREAYDAANAALGRGEPVEVEYRLIGYDGRTRWVLDRMRPEPSPDGRALVDGVVADITERKRAQEKLVIEAEKLAHLALHDPLTGLPNRVAFGRHLEAVLERAERTGCGAAVLFVDLDNFKLVNDSFGHAAGDELLKAVGSRLRAVTREADVVARQGGDEYLILLSDLEPEPAGGRGLLAAEVVAETLRRALGSPFLIEGIEIYVSLSIGISLYPNDAGDSETLLKHADVAMYAAKGAGRDGHARYGFDADTSLEQISMASRLRKAVEEGRGFVLHYQPLVELESAQVVGAEALLYWQDDERGLVSPGNFIPLAEQIGLIGAISDWVVAEACRQASAWRQRGLDLFVSINLPPSYCQSTGMAHVLSSADAAGLALEHLMIEITESALLPDASSQVEQTLSEMSKRGLRIAIDDFGTGYSSLGRLDKAWVSVLKVDRSFICDLPGDDHACRLVAAVLQLARTMGLEPVAEGIETEEQRRFVLERGCIYGQGFLFGRPMPASDLEVLCGGDELMIREVA